jgi:hypothetical protein
MSFNIVDPHHPFLRKRIKRVQSAANQRLISRIETRTSDSMGNPRGPESLVERQGKFRCQNVVIIHLETVTYAG